MTNERTIFETQDGSHSIYSEEFGVSYHSRYGAVQESQHVFIKGGLYPAMLNKKSVRILDVGFGTGLNAFLTYLESRQRPVLMDYEAIEAFPLPADQAAQLNYPTVLEEEKEAPIFYQLHRCDWEVRHSFSDFFYFRKVKKHIETIEYSPGFDLVYFDAFAPNAQPQLWEVPVLAKIYDALIEGGIFVTYCAKGAVKRKLKTLGFTVEALPGPPGKREMTRAIK